MWAADWGKIEAPGCCSPGCCARAAHPAPHATAPTPLYSPERPSRRTTACIADATPCRCNCVAIGSKVSQARCCWARGTCCCMGGRALQPAGAGIGKYYGVSGQRAERSSKRKCRAIGLAHPLPRVAQGLHPCLDRVHRVHGDVFGDASHSASHHVLHVPDLCQPVPDHRAGSWNGRTSDVPTV